MRPQSSGSSRSNSRYESREFELKDHHQCDPVVANEGINKQSNPISEIDNCQNVDKGSIYNTNSQKTLVCEEGNDPLENSNEDFINYETSHNLKMDENCNSTIHQHELTPVTVECCTSMTTTPVLQQTTITTDVNAETNSASPNIQESSLSYTTSTMNQPCINTTAESLHLRSSVANEEELLEDDQVFKPSDKILIENAKEIVTDTDFSFSWFYKVTHGWNSIRKRLMHRLLCRYAHEGDFSDDDEEEKIQDTSKPSQNNNKVELPNSVPNKEQEDDTPEIMTERKFETVHLNDREKNKLSRKRKWPTNYVRTTKYTLITFIPQNLFEQFRKAINIYLLITVIAVLIPDISPIFPPAAVLPITFIVLLQMAKDGYEDFQRYRQDLKANNELCRVVRNGSLQEIRVKDVEIGDFVYVSRDESFPADLLCIHSSREDELCYVETAHLDGETNLKTRRPLSKCFLSWSAGSSSSHNVHSMPTTPQHSLSEKHEGVDPMPPSITTARPTQEFIHSQLGSIKGKLKIEAANKNLDIFEGTAKIQAQLNPSTDTLNGITSNNTEEQRSVLPQQPPIKEALSMDNLLLRGCTLKNTQFIYGVAIYVGKDTKILNNTKENRVKRNALEVTLNQILAVLVLLQQVICAIVAGLHGAFQNDFMHRAFYLKPLIVNSTSDGMASFVSVMSNWVTIFILLNLIVNETLVIGFEVIKSFQSWSIESDPEMRADGLKTEVRTASMNQALSKMDIVFSDKTGTLTLNEMTYSDSYVDGVYYSERSNPGAMQNYLKDYHRSKAMKGQPQHPSLDHGSDIKDQNLPRILLSTHTVTPLIDSHAFFLREFLRCLSLNNSLMPELSEQTKPHTHSANLSEEQQAKNNNSLPHPNEPQEIHAHLPPSTQPSVKKYMYHGPSSDEIALVQAANNNGFILTQRSPQRVVVEELGELKGYEILATFGFTSERKRMSVVVKDSDGKYVCYVKGADSVILKRASDSSHHHELKKALQHFSVRGLRTLVCARRELSQHEFQEWFEEYTAASLSTKSNRDQLLMHCASLMERNLQIVGCTGIEDKLQDQVAESISYLQRAGLNIWVLTGDKTETAIHIAYSTHVLHRDRTIEIRIRNATSHDHVKAKLKEALEFLEKHKHKKHLEYALIIDSKALEYAMEKYEKPFVQLASKVQSAVCCRLKPLQKSSIVKLIEKNLSKKALAIGDGVNDVAMIQAASIGVGIKGKEGSQAARAADYALPRFKHLIRLLAVHGRNCCVRNADFLHFSFYKNFMLLVPQFFYIFYSAYSGILMYDSWEQLLFVAVYCFFQPIASGACEKDLPEQVIMKHPELYDTLKKKHHNLFSVSSLIGWGLVSIYQCAVIYFGIVLSYGTDGDTMENNSSIPSSDVYHFGKLIMTCLMSVVTLRYIIEVKTWTIPVFLSIFGSYIFYFLFSVCYAPSADVFGETGSYYIYYEMVISVKATLISILVIIVALLPNFLYKAVRMNFFPHDYQQLLIEYHHAQRKKAEEENIEK
ncbi:hypothetical protein C9374_008005 [Naegleria lovaniensis]|uniref:Phospholipid-transporting ATPase n=1 Tax=Naegleria lovaniensis TaxID=51637 RepID=A0AA88GK51_NAELO|nr:uncharacterized protein C9374_008005 [Naegleria lovaniensis]KAG2378857.1 hypothetical protein C9374_008005 [Naegleria lovaniensis]